ncbi:MAG: ArsB/NhaD family transporter [Chloroflexi bacterium]|nr:ArsB/NhaD family transporter [Chloroflexota bacterium]
MDVWVAGLVFVVIYAIIATDRLDKTVAALLGGVLMVVLGIVDQEEAFSAIDFNVIFLLAGMMAMAGILAKTGFFQWLAIRSVKAASGDPYRLLLVLAVITAVLSAFLDNVTTVVLIAPVTLYIATVLRVSPMPFLITEIAASNIGGTATLIGDPPNILIASAAGIDFVTFMANLGPPAAIIFVAYMAAVRFIFRGALEVHDDVRDSVLALDEREVLTEPRLLRVSLAVICATIVAFLFHGILGLEPATIALAGATLLMILGRLDSEDVLAAVEWRTLFFFIGLFMLVEGIVHVGIIAAITEGLLSATGGDQSITTLALLWLSGLASAIVDNIPYTATAIPIVAQMGDSGLDTGPLWWALALGADLGGNATIVGASANVVVASLAARAGHPISFREYLPYGVAGTMIALPICTAYVWVRYLI